MSEQVITERVFKAALLLGGFPQQSLSLALAKLGSYELLWKMPDNKFKPFLFPKILSEFQKYRNTHNPLKDLEYMLNNSVSLLFSDDPEYPWLLSQIYDPPPVIFVKGSLPKEDNLKIAVVGSRRPTYYGMETAKRLGRELAEIGVTVVSGLALGIDGAAHSGALSPFNNNEESCKTIAVLGSGIDSVYPRWHEKLARTIVEQGALVSEFPLGSSPLNWHFPKRNRIISGMSHGVVVVEAHEKSGALITANFALEQGREVFAVPGRVGVATSFGPNSLLRQGAKLVEGVNDILEEFPVKAANLSSLMAGISPCMDDKAGDAAWDGGGNLSGIDMEKDEFKGKIVELLSQGVEHLPEIAAQAAGWLLPPGSVERLLIMMELEGIVKRLPGNCYVLQHAACSPRSPG